MASSESRHRIEIPEGLWRQLDRAAAEEGLGASSLAGLWILERLRRDYPSWMVDDPYRYENGPRARRNDRPEPIRTDKGLPDAAHSTQEKRLEELTARVEELTAKVKELTARNDRPEPSHMQQAYAARLEEHQEFIENERGE